MNRIETTQDQPGRHTVIDSDGNVAAWIRLGGCNNPACTAACRDGRPYHLTPAHTDPRAADATLALPAHHFASPAEAADYLEQAWQSAVTVDNATDRDAAYAAGVPVRILNSGQYR